jgi:hypothetical protein
MRTHLRIALAAAAFASAIGASHSADAALIGPQGINIMDNAQPFYKTMPFSYDVKKDVGGQKLLDSLNGAFNNLSTVDLNKIYSVAGTSARPIDLKTPAAYGFTASADADASFAVTATAFKSSNMWGNNFGFHADASFNAYFDVTVAGGEKRLGVNPSATADFTYVQPTVAFCWNGVCSSMAPYYSANVTINGLDGNVALKWAPPAAQDPLAYSAGKGFDMPNLPFFAGPISVGPMTVTPVLDTHAQITLNGSLNLIGGGALAVEADAHSHADVSISLGLPSAGIDGVLKLYNDSITANVHVPLIDGPTIAVPSSWGGDTTGAQAIARAFVNGRNYIGGSQICYGAYARYAFNTLDWNASLNSHGSVDHISIDLNGAHTTTSSLESQLWQDSGAGHTSQQAASTPPECQYF